MNIHFTPSTPSATHVTFQRGTSADSARKADVLDIIEDNYDRFDRNGDGNITWTEMRKNIADPDFQGQDAAALATLYSLMEAKADELDRERKLSLTPDIWADIKSDTAWAREEGEEPLSDAYYERYLSKLENASTELFPQGMPDPYSVRQGYAPSCSMLATTVGQAVANPDVLKNALTVREDGKISVAFPGRSRPVVVAPTTDTETALFATSAENGTWINHVEKAWGKSEATVHGSGFEQSSWPADTIRAWTNSDVTTEEIPEKIGRFKKGEVPPFLTEAAENVPKGWLAVTWTRHEEPKLENIVSGHAHTVLGVDADNGTIRVRNPWGHQEPVDENGEPRDGVDDGIFDLTFKEFATDFGHIAVQTSPPGESTAA